MRRIVTHRRAGTSTLLSSPATRAELAGVPAQPASQRLAAAPLDELVRGLERFSEHVPGVPDLSTQKVVHKLREQQAKPCQSKGLDP